MKIYQLQPWEKLVENCRTR